MMMKSPLSAKKAALFAGVCTALVSLGCVSSPPVGTTTSRATVRPSLKGYGYSSRFKVAVLRFENKTPSRSNDRFLDLIQERIVSQLLQTQRMRMIERGKINALLKEHALAQKGVVDFKNAKKIGKMLSADALLIGTLVGIDTYQDTKTFIGSETLYRAKVSLSARIINVESSEVLASGSAEATVSGTESEFAGVASGNIDKQTIVNTAFKRAVDELSYKLGSLMPAKN